MNPIESDIIWRAASDADFRELQNYFIKKMNEWKEIIKIKMKSKPPVKAENQNISGLLNVTGILNSDPKGIGSLLLGLFQLSLSKKK